MNVRIVVKSIIVIFISSTFLSCSMKKLETVANVDIEKYMGKWYEIAAFPQSFQKGCSCTTAEYSVNKNGSVKVVNSCNVSGERKVTTGKAFIKDKKTNAKLAVQFFWPFRGKYWIIELADDYSYSVVGHPNRKYLWILSRTPQMDQDTYDTLVRKIASKGFDTSKLVTTDQNCWE